jgi:prophage regulatory protein
MQFIKLADVIKLTGLSRSSIYRGMRQGVFPVTIQIGARAVAWNYADVREWMEQCVEKQKLSAH